MWDKGKLHKAKGRKACQEYPQYAFYIIVKNNFIKIKI